MDHVIKGFDFLVSFSKSTPDEAAKLLIQASDEELKVLLDCLSLRTQVRSPPASKQEITFLKAAKRKKQLKKFLKSKIKLVIPMLVVVLAKAIQDILDCVCDLS